VEEFYIRVPNVRGKPGREQLEQFFKDIVLRIKSETNMEKMLSDFKQEIMDYVTKEIQKQQSAETEICKKSGKGYPAPMFPSKPPLLTEQFKVCRVCPFAQKYKLGHWKKHSLLYPGHEFIVLQAQEIYWANAPREGNVWKVIE
jgi:hypothetical protein